MELKIKQPTFPEVIEFNFDELKNEITDRVAMYTNLVYTEKQVKQAKVDRANLNKFVKALSDERIRVKKQCLQPYEAFEAKVNELARIVQEPIALIDEQVKGYEEKQKQEKKEAIKALWNEQDVPDGLTLEAIWDERFLNVSFNMTHVKQVFTDAIDKFNRDIATLSNLPEFGFEAVEVYKTTLDVNKAINEAQRMSQIAKAKAEREAAMRKIKEEQKAKAAEAEQIPGQVKFSDTKSFDSIVEDAKPARQWVKFQAYMTTADALALKEFFNSRQIEFKAI